MAGNPQYQYVPLPGQPNPAAVGVEPGHPRVAPPPAPTEDTRLLREGPAAVRAYYQTRRAEDERRAQIEAERRTIELLSQVFCLISLRVNARLANKPLPKAPAALRHDVARLGRPDGHEIARRAGGPGAAPEVLYVPHGPPTDVDLGVQGLRADFDIGSSEVFRTQLSAAVSGGGTTIDAGVVAGPPRLVLVHDRAYALQLLLRLYDDEEQPAPTTSLTVLENAILQDAVRLHILAHNEFNRAGGDALMTFLGVVFLLANVGLLAAGFALETKAYVLAAYTASVVNVAIIVLRYKHDSSMVIMVLNCLTFVLSLGALFYYDFLMGRNKPLEDYIVSLVYNVAGVALLFEFMYMLRTYRQVTYKPVVMMQAIAVLCVVESLAIITGSGVSQQVYLIINLKFHLAMAQFYVQSSNLAWVFYDRKLTAFLVVTAAEVGANVVICHSSVTECSIHDRGLKVVAIIVLRLLEPILYGLFLHGSNRIGVITFLESQAAYYRNMNKMEQTCHAAGLCCGVATTAAVV